MAQWNQVNLDLEIVRNDTLDLDIEFLDANGQGVPSATFSSARSQVRKSRGDAPVLTFQTSDSSLVLSDGNIKFVKSASQTDVTGGKYIHDIEFTIASSGQIVTPIRGTFVIKDDITY